MDKQSGEGGLNALNTIYKMTRMGKMWISNHKYDTKHSHKSKRGEDKNDQGGD